MKVGDRVRVRHLGSAYRDLLYAGWLGIITRVDDEDEAEPRYFVDSDEAVRRIGRRQAVSFREWFEGFELEPYNVGRRVAVSLDTHEVERLNAEVGRLRLALEKILEGAGPYNRDPLTHCANTVDAMKRLALEALRDRTTENIASTHHDEA